MRHVGRRAWMRSWGGVLIGLTLAIVCGGGCGEGSAGGSSASDGADEKVTTLGTIEVTAKLVEIIPYKEEEKVTFPPNKLYDYVYVMKYEVLKTHRGGPDVPKTLLIGHYNPLKPRAKAADARAEGIGGDLKRFRAGETHRIALEPKIDEHYMGPIINKYHGKHDGEIAWAVWTNRVGT